MNSWKSLRRRYRRSVPVLTSTVLLGVGVATASAIGLTLTVTNAVEVPGFGWVVAEDGKSVPQDVLDEIGKLDESNMTLSERIADAGREHAEALERPARLDPFGDHGSAEAIAEVRREVAALLRANLAAQVGSELPSDVEGLYRDIWLDSVLPKKAAELRRMMTVILPQDRSITLASSDVNLQTWHGIAVDGESAIAIADGTEKLKFASSRPDDVIPMRYQVHLKREHGRWQLAFVYDINKRADAG